MIGTVNQLNANHGFRFKSSEVLNIAQDCTCPLHDHEFWVISIQELESACNDSYKANWKSLLTRLDVSEGSEKKQIVLAGRFIETGEQLPWFFLFREQRRVLFSLIAAYIRAHEVQLKAREAETDIFHCINAFRLMVN